MDARTYFSKVTDVVDDPEREDIDYMEEDEDDFTSLFDDPDMDQAIYDEEEVDPDDEEYGDRDCRSDYDEENDMVGFNHMTRIYEEMSEDEEDDEDIRDLDLFTDDEDDNFIMM